MDVQESQPVHNIFSLITEAGQWTNLEANAKVSSLLDAFSISFSLYKHINDYCCQCWVCL
ncbi:hypothetical protein E2C01_005939 [Portunus trituberculatus]|uniref:Uncharacterized protein n=1 Tax=Portunus trituberculatus TaxID=210409 RepID=A0A5B7CXX9_PORTR|nr:hypothetical protein [Portunus trituberculatus]